MARTEDPEKTGRVQQIRTAYRMTKRVDPKIGLIVIGVGVVCFGVLLALGFVWGHPVYLGILGFLFGVMAMTVTFGRRAERAAYRQMEGQAGAAAGVLKSIRRGGFTVTEAVAANKSQDMIHRAVSKAGIVLIGEGNPNRVRTLMNAERRKMNRVVGGIPVHEVIVGDGEGQVSLRKLQNHLIKLRRTLPASEVTQINDRLRALGDLLSNMPIPKGPLPKGAKLPKGPKIR